MDIGCRDIDFLVVNATVCLFLLLVPFFLYLINSSQDNYNIKKELLWCLLIMYPFYVLYLSFTYFLKVPVISGNLWLSILVIGTYFISVYLPVIHVIVRRRANNKRPKIMAPEVSDEYLEVVLNDAKLLAQLREQTARELNMENLLFIEAFRNQELSEKQDKRISDERGEHVTADNDKRKRMELLTHFIDRDSAFELNLPASIFMKAREKVTSDGDISLESLRPAYTYIRTMYQLNTFMNFVTNLTQSNRV
jgi:hypothetical protein